MSEVMLTLHRTEDIPSSVQRIQHDTHNSLVCTAQDTESPQVRRKNILHTKHTAKGIPSSDTFIGWVYLAVLTSLEMHKRISSNTNEKGGNSKEKIYIYTHTRYILCIYTCIYICVLSRDMYIISFYLYFCINMLFRENTYDSGTSL